MGYFYTDLQQLQLARRRRAEDGPLLPDDLERTDIIVEHHRVKGAGTPEKEVIKWSFLIVECKRAELEAKSLEWQDAKDQLCGYLDQEFRSLTTRYGENCTHHFWGIISIGTSAELYHYYTSVGLRKVSSSERYDIATLQGQETICEFLVKCRTTIMNDMEAYINPPAKKRGLDVQAGEASRRKVRRQDV